MKFPPETTIHQKDTHRLIPSKYGDPVFDRIFDNADAIAESVDIERATNARVNSEAGLLPGIGPLELVWGVPFDHIINAAFSNPSPKGSRFNGPSRGAWYAGFERETSLAEVIYHKQLALWEIDYFEDSVQYDDFLADFTGDFHDIRDLADFEDCLDDKSYIASQKLADVLLNSGSLGIVYPSVRQTGGANIACFRPALVDNVRRGETCSLIWNGKEAPEVIWE